MKYIAILVLFLATLAPAQTTSFVSSKATGVAPFQNITATIPAPYAWVRVCQFTVGVIPSFPCTPLATVTDVFGNVLTVQGGNFGQLQANGAGRFVFGCSAGQIVWVQIQAVLSNQLTDQYPVTCADTNLVNMLGTVNTWTNTNTFNGQVTLNGSTTLAGVSLISGNLTVNDFVSLTSATLNAATSGQINLANTDSIKFFNGTSADITGISANGNSIVVGDTTATLTLNANAGQINAPACVGATCIGQGLILSAANGGATSGLAGSFTGQGGASNGASNAGGASLLGGNAAGNGAGGSIFLTPGTSASGSAGSIRMANSVFNDGSGFKHKRFGATTATAASVGAMATTTYSWTTPFANTNYSVTCTPDGALTNVPAWQGVTGKTAGGVTVSVVAVTAAAASFGGVDCIAVHD